MNTYLIEVSLGPVQGFIAAARRSRDLWAGSRLLSDCVRAAGNALLDAGAELIYPVTTRVRQDHDEESSNLSNILLARIDAPEAEAMAVLARTVKQAARAHLQEVADQALAAWTDAGVKIRADIWRRQVTEALEMFASWCRVDGDYRAGYERTKVALGARKNTRDFAPMFATGDERSGFGVPKSSLDGQHESVLPENRGHFPARFGVRAGEQLDALGCIKRVVGRQERFTALSRIAADGWLQGLPDEARNTLREACEPLAAAGLASRTKGNGGIYSDFPYDAGLLYPARLDVALSDADATRDGFAATNANLAAFKHALQPIWKEFGQPCPYAAIVVADGDRMGRFIDKARTAEQHSGISRAIATFADRVPQIAREHRGHAIYNGGEDLMVLFPLQRLAGGARALAQAFDEAMHAVVQDLLGTNPCAEDVPSLRVGAAICHVQEPLGVIRGYGEAAEKFAKGDAGTSGQGNALGIRLHVRAGHVVPWRARFDQPDDFASLQAWCDDYLCGKLPGKLAYRIRQAWMAGRGAGLDDEIISLEVRRAIEHASERGGENEITADVTRRLQQRADRWKGARPDDPTGYGTLIDEMILARWLSARNASDLGREDA